MKAISRDVSVGKRYNQYYKYLDKSLKKYLINKRLPKSFKSLAESIILQALEDIWDPSLKEDSLEFFNGEGFSICSSVASLDEISKDRIRQMLLSSGSRDVGVRSCQSISRGEEA